MNFWQGFEKRAAWGVTEGARRRNQAWDDMSNVKGIGKQQTKDRFKLIKESFRFGGEKKAEDKEEKKKMSGAKKGARIAAGLTAADYGVSRATLPLLDAKSKPAQALGVGAYHAGGPGRALNKAVGKVTRGGGFKSQMAFNALRFGGPIAAGAAIGKGVEKHREKKAGEYEEKGEFMGRRLGNLALPAAMGATLMAGVPNKGALASKVERGLNEVGRPAVAAINLGRKAGGVVTPKNVFGPLAGGVIGGALLPGWAGGKIGKYTGKAIDAVRTLGGSEAEYDDQ